MNLAIIKKDKWETIIQLEGICFFSVCGKEELALSKKSEEYIIIKTKIFLEIFRQQFTPANFYSWSCKSERD